MIKLYIFSMLIFSLSAGATENIGKEVKVFSENNHFHFGVQFAHDSDVGIYGVFTVVGADLVGDKCLTSVAYRFFNVATNAYASDWTIADYNLDCADLSGTYALRVSAAGTPAVRNILAQLSNLKLVLSVNFSGTPSKPTHNIDISSLCKSNPENFVDLTTSKTGCEITHQ